MLLMLGRLKGSCCAVKGRLPGRTLEYAKKPVKGDGFGARGRKRIYLPMRGELERRCSAICYGIVAHPGADCFWRKRSEETIAWIVECGALGSGNVLGRNAAVLGEGLVAGEANRVWQIARKKNQDRARARANSVIR